MIRQPVLSLVFSLCVKYLGLFLLLLFLDTLEKLVLGSETLLLHRSSSVVFPSPDLLSARCVSNHLKHGLQVKPTL